MSKINLLFITRDFSKNVERSTFYLIHELAKITSLQVWYEPGNIHDILSQIEFNPDFILLNDMKYTHCPEISGLNKLNLPFGIIIHDLHYKVKTRRDFIKENNVQYIFSIYRDAFKKRFPEFTKKFRWLPHFAHPSIFKDYGLPKEINWILMGNTRQKNYPLRSKILENMKEKRGFVFHCHPGYRDVKENEANSIYIGEKYAREINRSKIFLTCGLKYQYPVRKYYEVLACNTLLLAPSSKELRELGFLPGVHFVDINEDNFLKKAEYYLKHEKERHQIALQGFNLVHQYHTTEIRAQQLVEMIMDILQSRL